jgi:hypothetical protein
LKALNNILNTLCFGFATELTWRLFARTVRTPVTRAVVLAVSETGDAACVDGLVYNFTIHNFLSYLAKIMAFFLPDRIFEAPFLASK